MNDKMDLRLFYFHVTIFLKKCTYLYAENTTICSTFLT